jgi:hypothetical protein
MAVRAAIYHRAYELGSGERRGEQIVLGESLEIITVFGKHPDVVHSTLFTSPNGTAHALLGRAEDRTQP